MSDEELAHYMAKRNDESAIRVTAQLTETDHAKSAKKRKT